MVKKDESAVGENQSELRFKNKYNGRKCFNALMLIVQYVFWYTLIKSNKCRCAFFPSLNGIK